MENGAIIMDGDVALDGIVYNTRGCDIDPSIFKDGFSHEYSFGVLFASP